MERRRRGASGPIRRPRTGSPKRSGGAVDAQFSELAVKGRAFRLRSAARSRALPQHSDELFEQIMAVLRAGAGLWMILHAERSAGRGVGKGCGSTVDIGGVQTI